MMAVEQNLSVPMDELKKLVVKLLGFSRRTVKTDMVVERAVNYLKSAGSLTVTDGMVAVK